MSTVIYCPTSVAKQPFHLKSIDLHFFSLEELLFYYKTHELLVDRTIMEEEFVFWVKESLNKPVLAERLHQMIAGEATLTMFLEVLFEQVNTYTTEEKEEFLSQLLKLENKDEINRRKVLADQMLQREKYEAAIIEYRRMIQSIEHKVEEEEFLASIWHNLGCCYGRMFFFEQALECFRTAYSYVPKEQTQRAVNYVLGALEYKEERIMKEDNFINLLEQTDQVKREIRYGKIKERMQDYLRSTL